MLIGPLHNVVKLDLYEELVEKGVSNKWIEEYCNYKNILVSFLPSLFNALDDSILEIFVKSCCRIGEYVNQIFKGE